MEGFIKLLSKYAELPEPVRKFELELGDAKYVAGMGWPDQMLMLNVKSRGSKIALKKEGWEVANVSSTEAAAATSLYEFAEVMARLASSPDEQFEVGEVGDFGPSGLKALFRFLLSEVPDLPEPIVSGEPELPLAFWEDLNIAFVGEATKREDYPGVRFVGFSKEAATNASSLISMVDRFRFFAQLTESESDTEANTSLAERRLLQAMLDVGIDQPNRNRHFYYENGDLATIPDMAWEELKLVVELDGWFVHIGSELNAVITAAVKGAPERGKAFMERGEKSSVRDARKRRRLGELGWAYYVVHDSEVVDPQRAKEVARSIRTIIETRRQIMATFGDLPGAVRENSIRDGNAAATSGT